MKTKTLTTIFLLVLLTACGDAPASSTGPPQLPSAASFRGTVAIDAKPPTVDRTCSGFGDMFAFWRNYEERFGGCIPGRCWEIAITNGQDTVQTDAFGSFVFDSLDSRVRHSFHVIEALHPRFDRGEFVVPSTYWHFVEFDTLHAARLSPGESGEGTLTARRRNAVIYRFLIERAGGVREPLPGVRVDISTDTLAVHASKYSDEHGEVVLATPFDRCDGPCDPRRCDPRYYTRYVDEKHGDAWGGTHGRWRGPRQLFIGTLRLGSQGAVVRMQADWPRSVTGF